MPRRRTERKVGGYCKIRKRGCSSSTSSSSLVKNYRLKRAILVGKRAGSSTPVPTWKMSLRSPSLVKQCHGVSDTVKGKETKTSARRLAASLWEINGSQSPCDDHGQINSPVSKNKDGSKSAGHRRKSSAISQKLQLTEYIGGMESVTNEVGTLKKRLKDVSCSLAASKEIVKVLFRLWGQEEQSSSRLTLVSALRVEIDRARHQVDELVQEQRYSNSNSQKEVEVLLRQFAAEKAAWKSREEDRVYEAVGSIARELEIEKKLRRQSERLNKRIGRELAETRTELVKAVKGLECERRARAVLEQTCDELARGLGEDREEVERERQMLQLADVLREERVQMKLTEARYEYEEKNAKLERLRGELEKIQNGEREQCSEGEVEEDSGESELHSIELNMDNLNKSCKWSFVREQEQADQSRRPSVEEVFKGRRSLSEQIQWENICLQRKTSDGIEWDFTINSSRKQVNSTISQGERNDQKLINVCTSSRPESPSGKVLQGNSKAK